MSGESIKIDGLDKLIRKLRKYPNHFTAKKLKAMQRKASKPMVTAMKAGSKSTRLAAMTGATGRKKYAPPLGIRVGVVKNQKALFPDFAAQPLAAVIEYGTPERFHKITAAGGLVVTGRKSVGRVRPTPWLRPAYDANINRLQDRFRADAEKELQKVDKRD